LLVIAAGVSVALQQVLNARLRTGLGSPWWAGFGSYLGGMLVMLVVALLGAFFIGICILLIPRLGAATVLALIVVGQMVCALVMDHFGLLGIPQQAASSVRLAGAAFLVLGVILIRI
jgi:transporter family-2 protein